MLIAAYLLNRTPSPLLNGCTPYEILFQPPNFNDLKVFGCLCYDNVMPKSTDKFTPYSLKGVFVGYPFAKIGFKVLDLQTRQIVIARDVAFFETIFPFANIETPPLSKLFPDSLDYDPLYTEITPDIGPAVMPNESNTSCSDSTITPSMLSNSHDSTRPSCARKLPSRFTDYTGIPTHLCNSIQLQNCSTNSGTSLHSYAAALPFDPTDMSFVASTIKISEPSTYKQAIKSPVWCESMNVELVALEANGTWSV